MSSTSNPYTPYHDNFDEQNGLEWMTEDGARQHTTTSGLVLPSQLEPYQEWISQRLKDLMAVRAQIDAKLRELQDLYHKQQDTLTQLRAFNVTTTNTSWNIPHQSTAFTASTTPYAQTATHSPPEFTAHNRTDKNTFGYEASQQGKVTWQHRETFQSVHAKKSHICHCGRGYTRKDSLLRHAIIHRYENPYF